MGYWDLLKSSLGMSDNQFSLKITDPHVKIPFEAGSQQSLDHLTVDYPAMLLPATLAPLTQTL